MDGGTFPQKDAQNGNKDHIERSDKTGLGSGSETHAVLLGNACGAQHAAAGKPGDQKLFPVGGCFRPSVFRSAAIGEAVQGRYDGGQKDHGNPAAPCQIGPRADMACADALSDEGGAP